MVEKNDTSSIVKSKTRFLAIISNIALPVVIESHLSIFPLGSWFCY